MRLVVIGAVAAGLSAAARARRLDRQLDILVLEKGDAISYGACGLPYLVQNKVRHFSDLVVYSASYFQKERNIEVRTGAEVQEIEHGRRRLRLCSGEFIAYGKLIIATGARQDTGGIAGVDQPHVFSMNSPAAAVRLKQHLLGTKPGRAAVVGGGYIGLEAVEALRSYGWHVTLLHDGANLLHRDEPELTRRLLTHLDRFRVDTRLGCRVRTIHEKHIDGIACDLVVLATGLRPNVELAANAGIELGRTGAIRVSDHMETSFGGIYAAGDCAEAMHLVAGRPMWIPLGTTANKMGRVAGACAAGARERFAGIAGTSIVRVCGLAVALTGLSLPQAKAEGLRAVSAWVKTQDRAAYFQGRATEVELVADQSTGRLLGATVIGEHGVEGRINVVAAALQTRMRLDDFLQLDLAYAPPFAPVWDPLLIAAQQLQKQF
ncbi:MAG: FAD-dependent oxidoreductase [Acidobacteriia bacterium]|nr:FAD-dependent oxidoreductase [Terriglobia bacterium]